MNFKTNLLTLLLSIIIILPASAAKWRVNNTFSSPGQVDFNELKDAVDSDDVLSGDTIYVEASGIPYLGEIQVYKQLTIIGPGYLLNQPHIQPSVCGDQLTATIEGKPGISLNAGSDGTYITGLSFNTTFANPVSINFRNTSNITITRNRIEEIAFEYGTTNQYYNLANIIISRNLIRDDIGFGCYVNIANLTISNNLIGGNIDRNCGNNVTTNIDGAVTRNNFFGNTSGYIWIKGCTISYNLVGQINADPAENGSIDNNRLGVSNPVNDAIVANNNTNIISPYTSTDWDWDTDDWTLSPPDADHGAHTGFDPINPNNPISKANIPAWPTIYECSVQPCADSVLQVIFQVRTNF